MEYVKNNSNWIYLTPTEFAAKIGVHQTTISRWMAHDFSKRKFKAYDAEVVEVAGKKFVRVVSKTGKV